MESNEKHPLVQYLKQTFLFLFAEPHQSTPRRRPVSVPVRVIIGLLALIAIGTILMMLPGIGAGQRLPFDHAVFTATSALTITGLSVITASMDLTTAGQILLLILIQIGGVGYMFIVALALRVVGRRIPLLDRLALSNSLGLETPAALAHILWRVLFGILLIEGIGAVLLYWHWQSSGIVAAERVPLYAIFHAVSAFCNAGFDLFVGLPEYPRGIPGDNTSLLIMGTLSFTGGLGVPVLSELFSWSQQKQFSLHTRVTLALVVILTLAGWVGLFVPETREGVLRGAPLSQQLVRTLFQSVATRSSGFPGLEDFHNLAPESQLLVMALMFIGGAPASMGGGITTGTFAVLVLALWGYARGLPTAQLGKRTISLGTVRRAGAVLTISIGLVLLSTWLILLTHPFTLSTALFEVVSAFATCGLSLGITGSLNPFGQLVIMAMMVWGRLGALTIVTAIAQRGAQAHTLVDYPEGTLLIG